jgi:hypothetical protein
MSSKPKIDENSEPQALFPQRGTGTFQFVLFDKQKAYFVSTPLAASAVMQCEAMEVWQASRLSDPCRRLMWRRERAFSRTKRNRICLPRQISVSGNPVRDWRHLTL